MNKYKIDNRENKELFIFPYGLDDLLVFASCLKRYKDKNPDKLLFLYVLAPAQPGFKSLSFMKELAMEYDFIEDVFELDNVVVNKKNNIQVDKKAIENQVKNINRYYRFSKVETIELATQIKRDDYRYNCYFQFCTLLKLDHDMPEYSLPKVELGCANLWKKDHGIKKTDKYIVVQLSSKFESKKADRKLYDLILEKIKIPDTVKIIEVGPQEIEGSILISPEDVRTTTLIDIINGASMTICNNSLVYAISGILDKKTYCIVNPASAPLIRDYIYNYSTGNIMYLAVDKTLEEWEQIRKVCPFILGNPAFKREITADFSSVNLYNPTQKIKRLNRSIFAKRDEMMKKIKAGEEITRPVLWYAVDEGSLSSGGHQSGNLNIKLQLLDGLPTALAYKELGHDSFPATVTNIFKPFY